jgi:hypothetical protein
MPAPYFELLGHVLLAAHTAEHDEDCAAALKGAGLGHAQIEAGVKLAHLGEELVELRMSETVEDKNLEHCIHSAVAELEMWAQTVAFQLRKGGITGELLEQTLGHDVHGEKHTATAIAQAMRIIGMIRSHEALQAAIGDGRKSADLLTRGQTLLKKVYKWTDDLALPNSIAPESQEVFRKIFKQVAEMTTWLNALDVASERSNQLEAFGKLGRVAPGKGLPVGGTSHAVTLHQRAQKAAPDHVQKTTSGWSMGRQGNRENLGKGWIAPEYTDPLNGTGPDPDAHADHDHHH